MLKKDIKKIREAVLMERESGHIFCDFDDRQHDLIEIADVIGAEMYQNEDYDWVIADKDKKRVEECLQYYYDLH